MWAVRMNFLIDQPVRSSTSVLTASAANTIVSIDSRCSAREARAVAPTSRDHRRPAIASPRCTARRPRAAGWRMRSARVVEYALAQRPASMSFVHQHRGEGDRAAEVSVRRPGLLVAERAVKRAGSCVGRHDLQDDATLA
jgi:hypothetical protein